MTSYTPGPYAVMPNATGRCVVLSAEGEPLAMTYGQEHQEGDARLFAEAPAMVEALRDMIGLAWKEVEACEAMASNDSEARYAAVRRKAVEDAEAILSRIEGSDRP